MFYLLRYFLIEETNAILVSCHKYVLKRTENFCIGKCILLLSYLSFCNKGLSFLLPVPAGANVDRFIGPFSATSKQEIKEKLTYSRIYI